MIKFSKTMAVILVLCSLVFSTSCGYNIYDEGIENFVNNDSNISICAGLMPGNHEFIDMFEYTDANYFFRDSSVAPGYRHVERVLVYFEYDPAVYEVAKEYCQENKVLSESNTFEHNGYKFVEDVECKETDAASLSDYPKSFRMFVYNDDNCTLLFMGFYCSIEVKDEVEKSIEEGWEVFLDEYFGEFYSFE